MKHIFKTGSIVKIKYTIGSGLGIADDKGKVMQPSSDGSIWNYKVKFFSKGKFYSLWFRTHELSLDSEQVDDFF